MFDTRAKTARPKSSYVASNNKAHAGHKQNQSSDAATTATTTTTAFSTAAHDDFDYSITFPTQFQHDLAGIQRPSPAAAKLNNGLVFRHRNKHVQPNRGRCGVGRFASLHRYSEGLGEREDGELEEDLYDYDFGCTSCASQQRYKEPIALLLGWAGSRDSQLVNYSRIYDVHGCITIRYLAKKDIVVRRSTDLLMSAEFLLELLADLNIEDHPLFVHSFSDTGAMLYRYISESLHNKQEYKNIKLGGVIFDGGPQRFRLSKAVCGLVDSHLPSAPTSASGEDYGLEDSPDVAAKADLLIVGAAAPSSLRRCYARASAWVVAVVYFCFCMANHVINKWTDGKVATLQFDVYSALLDDPNPAPQIYIYSEKDDRFSNSDVDFMVNHRKNKGINSMKYMFTGNGNNRNKIESEKQSMEYSNICTGFLDRCLEDPLITKSF